MAHLERPVPLADLGSATSCAGRPHNKTPLFGEEGEELALLLPETARGYLHFGLIILPGLFNLLLGVLPSAREKEKEEENSKQRGALKEKQEAHIGGQGMPARTSTEPPESNLLPTPGKHTHSVCQSQQGGKVAMVKTASVGHSLSWDAKKSEIWIMFSGHRNCCQI